MMLSQYLKQFYAQSLGLLTDLYELTMAYGYWKLGIMDRKAAFQLFFRKKPYKGNFAIVAGIETAVEFMERYHFDESDLSYLETLKTSKGEPLFEKKFLDYLHTLHFSCDVDAMSEGCAVFPYEPIMIVTGPILQAQLLESALLNIVNFQSLIATKAARICLAAEGDEVIEFGLRRAQGIDGALSASRAAFIGGCPSTSNVLAGKYFSIPVKGTHAHSWIMAFDRERIAFERYAETLPQNCIYLIDTYDSIQGAKNAIEVAKEMRKRGCEMFGVRLDSGDLAKLSKEVRVLLDEAGFKDAKIMASNELDEYIIRDLKQQGAKINLWGVGTHLVTGKDQSAIDGVYKLSAIKDENGKWNYRIKLSEQMAKITNPGLSQVRRYYNGEYYFCDMIYDKEIGITKEVEIIDTLDPTKRKKMTSSSNGEDLLIPVLRNGKKVYQALPLEEIQKKAKEELSRFHPEIRRFLSPSPYFVGLERELYDKKMVLIDEIKSQIP